MHPAFYLSVNRCANDRYWCVICFIDNYSWIENVLSNWTNTDHHKGNFNLWSHGNLGPWVLQYIPHVLGLHLVLGQVVISQRCKIVRCWFLDISVKAEQNFKATFCPQKIKLDSINCLDFFSELVKI